MERKFRIIIFETLLLLVAVFFRINSDEKILDIIIIVSSILLTIDLIFWRLKK